MSLTAFSPLTTPRDFSTSPALASQSPVKRAKQGGTVQFSGTGDMVSSFISLIDSSRPIELIASDGFGMLAPRTFVAAGFRGVDDARETLIREGAGLVCVAMLAGLSNQFMIHVLGNKVGFYNPHGTPAKAWISAKNLRVYSELYDHALNNDQHRNLSEARQGFIQEILQRLESGDRKLSIDGRLATLKSLLKTPANRIAAEDALKQMVEELNGPTITPNEQKNYLNQLAKGEASELRQRFLDGNWGQLTDAGKVKLSKWFTQKGAGEAQLQGTTPFDAQAWHRVDEFGKKLSTQERHASFLKERLQLSLNHLNGDAPLFAKSVDEIALDHGLTSVVNLKDTLGKDGHNLIEGQSRQTLLKELKAFLEHYVDRASFEVETLNKGSKSALDWKAEQKTLVQEKLFASSSKGLRALFPQASDGLVTATLKAKTGYTVVPIAIAIIANGITTFMNNYITQKKYGGKVFFPGEEASLPGKFGALAGQPTQTGRFA